MSVYGCRSTPCVVRTGIRMQIRMERRSSFLIHTLAKLLARLEVRDVLRWEGHRCAGLGVSSDPPGSEMEREAAKAPNLDSVATRETLRHVLEDRLDRQLDVPVDELGLLLRNPFDQLRLRHLPVPPPFNGKPRRSDNALPSRGDAVAGTARGAAVCIRRLSIPRLRFSFPAHPPYGRRSSVP